MLIPEPACQAVAHERRLVEWPKSPNRHPEALEGDGLVLTHYSTFPLTHIVLLLNLMYLVSTLFKQMEKI
jgi:hypothetical protein